MASPPSDLGSVRLRRRALPERDLAAVSLRTRLLDRNLPAPVVLIGELATLSAADVRGRDGLWMAADLLERTEAYALRIHIDPLGGDTDFSGVAEGIAAVVGHVAPTPVVAAVTGLDFDDAVLLREAGVAAIELRGPYVAEMITDARTAAPGLPLLIAADGLDGEDVAKCLALGATAAALTEPDEALVEQLRIATWLAGAGHVQELGREHLR